MAKIIIENLWKEYRGGVQALKDVSFEVSDGEFLVVFGPAGAGKTTLLKTIAGLVWSTSGRIIIDGKDVSTLPANQRNVAMTFEEYALYPQFTVYENLANSLRAPGRNHPETDIRQRVQAVAEMLQIEHLLERNVEQLSGGQKQRVSLGRSMVREPHVFLFDEPLSHVDAKVRSTMRAELHRLERRLHTASIYVTHDYVEALSLGKRVLVLVEGEVIQVGTPHEVYHKPVNRLVASLIGQPEMNFIRCEVEQSNGDLSLRQQSSPAVNFMLTPELQNTLARWGGGSVELAIRPQDIAYHFEPGAGDTAGLAGEVIVYEAWGTRGMMLVEASNQRYALLTPPGLNPKPHQPVWLQPKPERFILFDPQTGANLTLKGGR